MRVVSVAYWAIAARLTAVPRGGGDASHAELMPVADIQSDRMPLAFDHRRIVDDAVDRLRADLETTTIAHSFCPPEFTIRELQEVYEAIWQAELPISTPCIFPLGGGASGRRWRSSCSSWTGKRQVLQRLTKTAGSQS